jgi:hypothetical protein
MIDAISLRAESSEYKMVMNQLTCPMATIRVACCVAAKLHAIRGFRDFGTVVIAAILRHMRWGRKGGTFGLSLPRTHQIRNQFLKLINSIMDTIRDLGFS